MLVMVVFQLLILVLWQNQNYYHLQLFFHQNLQLSRKVKMLILAHLLLLGNYILTHQKLDDLNLVSWQRMSKIFTLLEKLQAKNSKIVFLRGGLTTLRSDLHRTVLSLAWQQIYFTFKQSALNISQKQTNISEKCERWVRF